MAASIDEVTAEHRFLLGFKHRVDNNGNRNHGLHSVSGSDADNQRMLELMLAPIERKASSSANNGINSGYGYGYGAMINKKQSPASSPSSAANTTLDLLGCLNNDQLLPSVSAVSTSCSYSAVELESGAPLPSGWEKCLDLKTGSIYFLNRTTGVSSAVDPRKTYPSQSKPKADLNWPPSPSTSGLTIEAPKELTPTPKPSKTSPLGLKLSDCANVLSMLEPEGLDLSLNLNMHPSPKTSNEEKHVQPFHNFLGNETILFKGLRSTSHSGTSTSSSTTSSASPTTSGSFDNHSGKKKHPRSPQMVSLRKDDAVSPQSFLSNKANASYQLSNLEELLATKTPMNFDRNAARSSYSNSKNNNIMQSLLGSNVALFRGASDATAELETSHGMDGKCNRDAAMVTIACTNCLMFVMISNENPNCPRCGSSCPLLDSDQPNAKRPRLGFSL